MHEPSSSRSEPLDASGLRIGLVVSRYHSEITDGLRDGAMRIFEESGGRDKDLRVVPAPGSFELVAVCNALVRHADLHGMIALGCIITGETAHDKYLAHAVAQGLTQITVQTGLPIGFGVLTCDTFEQARERAGGAVGNKGAEVMTAIIHTIHTLRAIATGGES